MLVRHKNKMPRYIENMIDILPIAKPITHPHGGVAIEIGFIIYTTGVMNLSRTHEISTDFDVYNRHANSTIVCVTDQINCERIIKKGKEIADKTHTNLYVINIDTGHTRNLEAIEHLFRVTKDNGGVMNIFYNKQVLDTIINCIGEYNAINVVSGIPQTVDSILNQLWESMPQIDYYMIGLKGDITLISTKKTAINQ